MNQPISRRTLLARITPAATAFVGLTCWRQRRLDAAAQSRGAGPLTPDPNGLLDLPRGFRYTIISSHGEAMDDGLLVPARHDGMAAFPGQSGETILVRNHEAGIEPVGFGAFGRRYELASRVPPEMIFDRGHGTISLGGTTTIVFDTRAQKVLHAHLSLAGTLLNCAGGPTPWGSWLSCEETEQRRGPTFEQDHGWVFEVPSRATAIVKPEPLRAMGRFMHEAVAVDPATGIVYQTEDQGDGLFYRFIPKEPGNLRAGGRLQALALADRPKADTRNWGELLAESPAEPIAVGSSFRVIWIDIEEVESPRDDLRWRGRLAGAACFARGEGAWFSTDEPDRIPAIYFACTNGGAKQFGQIWRYRPASREGREDEAMSERAASLDLFAESSDEALLRNCDNLTVAPWGDLLICEDGSGTDRVVGLTPSGTFYEIARNAASGSELCGVVFSPDGSTLFVNCQEMGLTYAITGPWPERGSTG